MILLKKKQSLLGTMFFISFAFLLIASTNIYSQVDPSSLHVQGNILVDGDGKQIVLRGPELVTRWGTYDGLTSAGVDVPWEGGTNGNVGSATVREMAKTKCNAIRIYGGIGNGLDGLLSTAIFEQKMFVGIGRVDWANAQMKSTIQKYGKYVFIHPRGEFTHRDAAKWRTEALTVVKYIRGLGYTQAIEIGTTGYGQTWSTIKTYGKEVADSDPLKNTFFLMQLYSEYSKSIPSTLDEVAAFPIPVDVGTCLFNEGIKNNYGNDANSYKSVWDETFKRNIGSFYWDWYGDGNGNSMTSNGNFANINAVGKYICNESTGALSKTTKTSFLLTASLNGSAVAPSRNVNSKPLHTLIDIQTASSNGNVTFFVSEPLNNCILSIFNVNGTEVYTKSVNGAGKVFSIDSKLTKGTYILKLKSNGNLITKHLIITK